MGDRASISFVDYWKDGTVSDESVALFDQWGGPEFAELASKFVKDNQVTMKDEEANFAMVAFIRSLKPDRLVYLGKDEKHGDNSDNGHFRINLKDGSIKQFDVSDDEEEENILKKQNSQLKSKLAWATQQLGAVKRELEKGLD